MQRDHSVYTTWQFFKSFTHDAVNSFVVMLLYLVEPESSRTLCCKVYKLICVTFKRSVFRTDDLEVYTH